MGVHRGPVRVTGGDLHGSMAARMARNEAEIAQLREDARAASHRAALAEDKAESDHRRIDALEERADVDREFLEELKAEGILRNDREANLEVALKSARVIGAAVGIVMARRGVTETTAFDLIKIRSQNTNCKLRTLAEEIVHTGDVSALP